MTIVVVYKQNGEHRVEVHITMMTIVVLSAVPDEGIVGPMGYRHFVADSKIRHSQQAHICFIGACNIFLCILI